MALGPLTLNITSGIVGRSFSATISGQSSGSTVEVVGYDGTPGFSTVNGRVLHDSLPSRDPATVVLRETKPGEGTRDSRIDIAIDGGAAPDVSRDRWASTRGINVAPPSALLNVQTRLRLPDSLATANIKIMAGKMVRIGASVTSIQTVDGNFYCTTTGEANPGNPITITRDIETPDGTLTRVTWGGQPSLTLTDGRNDVLSDPIPLTLPKGTWIRVNSYHSAGAGQVPYFANGNFSAAVGDKVTLGAGAVDQTGGAWTGAQNNAGVGPIAIVSTFSGLSVTAIGDSRFYGAGGVGATSPFIGEVESGLGGFMPVLNLARGSQTAQQVAGGTAFAKRMAYLKYANAGIIGLGINDLILSGRTAAQILADRLTITGFASFPWWETTVGPVTTGSWTDQAGQTVVASNGERIILCDTVRGGRSGFRGFFDCADAIESARNSGKLKSPPQVLAAITVDGTHENPDGYALLPPYVRPDLIRIS